MNEDSNPLDDKIRAKFQLFTGVRTEEEDQAIFDKVYDLCFDEMLVFLGEELGEKESEKFLEELDKQASEEDKIKHVLTSITKIEDYNTKLDQRLDVFLDQLLSSSLGEK